jgi:beta-glucanase (GH16 family)
VSTQRALLLAVLFFVLAIPSLAQDWGTPAWSDEFSGPRGTPDPAKWTYDLGILKVNDELEYYCAPSNTTGGCDPANPNAYLDGNGHLVIQALRLNSGTVPYSGSWTSARLTSYGLKSFQYGRVEAKMSLPVGPGIWPAFWSLGTDIQRVGWPTCGEQDYMEDVPEGPRGLGPRMISSTLHGNSNSGDPHFWIENRYKFTSGDVTGYHLYGAIWSPGMVQFYVDDPSRVFAVVTGGDLKEGQTWAFDHPFYLILNLAIGGDWPGPPDASTPSPAVMTVDYVRIFKTAPISEPKFDKPPAIVVKAGATKGNSTAFRLTAAPGSGRIFLSCATDAPKATCAVTTNDSLNTHTIDLATASSGNLSVTVATTDNASGSDTIARGHHYKVTVNAYGLSSDEDHPSATVTIPLSID